MSKLKLVFSTLLRYLYHFLLAFIILFVVISIMFIGIGFILWLIIGFYISTSSIYDILIPSIRGLIGISLIFTIIYVTDYGLYHSPLSKGNRYERKW